MFFEVIQVNFKRARAGQRILADFAGWHIEAQGSSEGWPIDMATYNGAGDELYGPILFDREALDAAGPRFDLHVDLPEDWAGFKFKAIGESVGSKTDDTIPFASAFENEFEELGYLDVIGEKNIARLRSDAERLLAEKAQPRYGRSIFSGKSNAQEEDEIFFLTLWQFQIIPGSWEYPDDTDIRFAYFGVLDPEGLKDALRWPKNEEKGVEVMAYATGGDEEC